MRCKNVTFLSLVILIILSCAGGTKDVADTTTQFDISGTWEGILKTGGIDLRIVFHITRGAENTYTATIDSPDQDAFNLAVTAITFRENTLELKADNIGGKYKGSLIKDTAMEGTWSQGGLSIPLTLTRVKGTIDYSRPQDPKKPYPYQSKDIRFINRKAGIALAGTFTYPAKGGPFTAVILISGSGPQDRNEEIMGHRPFLVLSDYLTRNGIAVLRFDDRGVGESRGDFAVATTFDFATDANAAVAWLKEQTDVKLARIGLVGHSEGGLIATIVASNGPGIDFVVLMAGPGFSGDEILLQQNEAILRAQGVNELAIGSILTANRELFRIMRTEKDPAAAEIKVKEYLASLGVKGEELAVKTKQLANPWMRFFLSYDPIPDLEKLTIPVLALGGSLDLQVLAAKNLPAIERAVQKAGNKKSFVKEFKGLNHLFQTAKTGLVDEYAKITETMAPQVLEFITAWIKALQ